MQGPTAAAMRSTLGADRNHRGDRLVGYSCSRPSPAGMNGTNDTRLGIGKEDRRAVGGDDSKQ